MILQSNSKCKHVLFQNGLQLKILIKIDIEYLNHSGKHIVDQLIDLHIDDDMPLYPNGRTEKSVVKWNRKGH